MNTEQEQFRASLHDLLTASDVPAVARAWAASSFEPGLALWRKLAGLGVTALAIPESYDGIGATATDLVVAFEELGHHAVPGPTIETIAVLPTLLSRQSTPDNAAATLEALAADWLPRLAAGDALATIPSPHGAFGTGMPEPHSTDSARMPGLPGAATPASRGIRGVDGARATAPWRFAPDATVAGLPFGGVAGDPVASVDPARFLSRVDGGEVPMTDAAWDVGALACAAQLLGLGQAMLELSVQYVQQRVQFGQAIGRFQAVKHHVANARIALDFARPLVYCAAESLAPVDISAAKAACNDAANTAARVSLQVHGAIGYTREYDLSLWLLKARALIPAWGTSSWHRSRIMGYL